MHFDCLFSLIRWVTFSVSSPEMLFTLDDGRRMVGMLGCWPLAALMGFLPGESCSRRVSAIVYLLRDCLVVCSMLSN